MRRVVPATELLDLIDDWRRRATGRVDPVRADALRECADLLEEVVTEDEEDDECPC